MKMSSRAGFSLVESIVSLAIFSLVLTAAITQYADFDKNSKKINDEISIVNTRENLTEMLGDAKNVHELFLDHDGNLDLKNCLLAGVCIFGKSSELHAYPSDTFNDVPIKFSFSSQTPDLIEVRGTFTNNPDAAPLVAYLTRYDYMQSPAAPSELKCAFGSHIVGLDFGNWQPLCRKKGS